MGNREDYEKRLDEIKAIPDKVIVTKMSPKVADAALEAENLYKFCIPYKKEFIYRGLDWNLCEEIPERVGALREAESRYAAISKAVKGAAAKWDEEHRKGYELRDEIIAAFKYAYSENHSVKILLKKILSGSNGAAARIQSLNDLAVLGENHPEELKKMHFDMELLNEAAKYSDQLSELHSEKESVKKVDEAHKIRNQAYTFLKVVVLKLKRAGKYIFRNDKANKRRFNVTFALRRRKTDKKLEDEFPPDPDENK